MSKQTSKNAKTLTAKQERFCQEYVVDFNATQAAIRAGYAENSADVQGPRLLGNVRITERIEELKGELEQHTQMTKQEIIEGIESLATAADTHHTRLKAYELLMKYHGMLVDRSKIEHSGNGMIFEIKDARS